MPEPVLVSFVWRDEQYHDVKGRIILERSPVCGTPPADFCRYRSLGTIEAKMPNGQVLRRDFIVPLPAATSVAEAFDQVDEAGQQCKGAAIAQFESELARSRLVAPPPGMMQQILRGPNGGQRKF
jgi:hypothetical protein